jgi:hypothetical protein
MTRLSNDKQRRAIREFLPMYRPWTHCEDRSMFDPDFIELCEHDVERDECAVCAEREEEGELAPDLDASVEIEAHLAGVPFN